MHFMEKMCPKLRISLQERTFSILKNSLNIYEYKFYSLDILKILKKGKFSEEILWVEIYVILC
jgi:hypothetical protein